MRRCACLKRAWVCVCVCIFVFSRAFELEPPALLCNSFPFFVCFGSLIALGSVYVRWFIYLPLLHRSPPFSVWAYVGVCMCVCVRVRVRNGLSTRHTPLHTKYRHNHTKKNSKMQTHITTRRTSQTPTHTHKHDIHTKRSTRTFLLISHQLLTSR